MGERRAAAFEKTYGKTAARGTERDSQRSRR